MLKRVGTCCGSLKQCCKILRHVRFNFLVFVRRRRMCSYQYIMNIVLVPCITDGVNTNFIDGSGLYVGLDFTFYVLSNSPFNSEAHFMHDFWIS
jgi:hypothetical protein